MRNNGCAISPKDSRIRWIAKSSESDFNVVKNRQLEQGPLYNKTSFKVFPGPRLSYLVVSLISNKIFLQFTIKYFFL